MRRMPHNLRSVLLRQCISEKCVLVEDGRSDDKRATDRNSDFTSHGSGHVQICKRSRLRRFFQSPPLGIPHDLRKCKTLKPLATIHLAKQAPKKINGCFLRLFRAPKPTRFVLGKNETAGFRFRNSSRICSRVCLKRLCEDTRRDSAACRPRPTTQLELTGMAPR